MIEKLPKGAKLEIIEHNVDNDIHYETSVKGRIGVGEEETTVPLEPYTDKAKESTYEYAFTIPEEGATTHFTNNYTVEQSVVLNKIGYNNIDESEVPLAGATFRIYADEKKTKTAFDRRDGYCCHLHRGSAASGDIRSMVRSTEEACENHVTRSNGPADFRINGKE